MNMDPSFHASGPVRRKSATGRVLGRLFVTCLFLTLLSAGALVGYVAAQANRVTPGWVPASVSAAFGRVLGTTPPSPADRAELKGYEFQLVTPEVKQGDGIVTVRLVSTADGKPVPDAVIFASRLDMAPDGMATMTSSLDRMPAPAPGLYAFKADLIMEGNWRLSLAAKVQGETGTAQTRLTFKAVE